LPVVRVVGNACLVVVDAGAAAEERELLVVPGAAWDALVVVVEAVLPVAGVVGNTALINIGALGA
jgi:hypothetical protein